MAQRELTQADIDNGYLDPALLEAWAAGAAAEARHSMTMLTVVLFFTGGTLWGALLMKVAEALWRLR